MQRIASSEPGRFGLTVGTAFAVLGIVSWARGHVTAPQVLWALGVPLIVIALVAPSVLRPVQRVWMGAATVLGAVNTRIILSAVFFLLLTPLGLVRRLFSDPLRRSLGDRSGSQWVRREPQPVDLARYERSF
jgi:polyferredoxin